MKPEDHQLKRYSLTGHEEPNGEFVRFDDLRPARTKYVMRAYRDGVRYAVRLIREYEIEHNKQYRERLAQHIEEKAK